MKMALEEEGFDEDQTNELKSPWLAMKAARRPRRKFHAGTTITDGLFGEYKMALLKVY